SRHHGERGLLLPGCAAGSGVREAGAHSLQQAARGDGPTPGGGHRRRGAAGPRCRRGGCGMMEPVIMPVLDMTMERGIILRWLKKEGDPVRAGEPLFEVETDKADIEVEAPADGVLARIVHPEGAEVPVREIV